MSYIYRRQNAPHEKPDAMTTLNPYRIKIIRFFLCVLFAAACTFTTTRTKDPDFKVDLNIVQDSLKTLVTCEHINLNGTEMKTDGKISSDLEIKIINGIHIPGDDAKLKDLGKAIASQLKRELKNKNDFTTYKVLFVTKQTDGAVTKSSYRGVIYKSEEL
jgi:hypothetical protein